MSQIFQALFTEPVTNVSSSSVFLREVGGGMVPLELIGTDPDGNVGPVSAATEVVALTLRPLQGLKFSSSYELVFAGEIIDTDSERLTPDPTVIDFSTFAPEKLGEAQANQAAGVVVVGNRAFVAQNTYPGKLRVFDLSDPTQPQPSDETNFFYGLFRRIVALEGVDFGLGPTDVVAVLSVNPLSGQGILTVYDVAGEPPFPWIAVVTTTQPPMTSMGLALMGSSGYVAAGEEGVKIFDIDRAADLYRNTKKPGESDPGFTIGRSLNTKGQGFAQEALLDAVTLTAPGGTLRATSLSVGNTVLGRAAFVGSYLPSDSVGYFSSVNVSGSGQNEEAATLRLEKDSLAMGTPARIGLTSVGDQELAVAVGGFGSPKRGRLAVIDITQPAAPVILSITELRVSSGNSLEFDPNGTTLFVGTSEGLEVYDLTNPASPTWAGSLAGAGEEVAVASQIVVTAGGDVGLNVHLLAAAIDDFTDDLQQPSLTGTVQAPDPNDHVFVTSIPTNNECQFRTSGPIVFNIEIGRYVGEVEEDGTLVHAARLIANGFLSRNATLTIAGYDVDSGVPRNPEIDRVLVNGEEVGTLRGRKNEWTKSSFQVPMEFLRFPGRPQPGASLTPQTNEVRVEIDVGSVPNEARWCTAIDWGSLAFKTVSPIILIHGNGSDGDFFKRQGFTEYLEAVRFPFDNSINLVPKENFVHINAEKLNERIPVIVKSFGVDSVHLVVHSKGGLDSRDYLARFQPDHDDEFKVLSFTSLSTPHNGSIGADVLLLNERASFEAARSEFVDFPTFTDLATAFIGVANGKRNLTTTFAAHFNTRNVPLLPQDIVFNVVAADADINGSTKVDTLEEIRGMTLEDQKLADVLAFSPAAAVFLVDRAYQLLRGTQSIQYVLGSGQIFQGTPNERTERTIPIAKLTSIQPPRPLGNDALVTIPSGFGEGSLEPRVTKRLELRGEDLKGVGEGGRNHASVADLPVASKVLPWIVEVEEARGDLK